MKETKQQLRKQILAKIAAYSKQQHKKKSASIAKKLFQQEEWKKISTIGITLSRDREVDTRNIIEMAWLEGKKIAVPKCDTQTRTMTFRYISSFQQLEIVYMNLEEPIPSATEEANASDLSLLIVPGLAFTKRGERLGYGGGFYDRYLSDYKGKTIALAFSEQMVSHIPTEEHDQRVQKIITDESTIRCF